MFKQPCTVKLAGVSFGSAQANIKTYGSPDIRWFALVREPDNPHDSNAIRVALFGEFFMGYIPKDVAIHLAPVMDAGSEFDAEFICVNKHPHHDVVGLHREDHRGHPASKRLQRKTSSFKDVLKEGGCI